MPSATLFQTLDRRRRRLGMTYAILARQSGVSVPTVVRILSGKHAGASFEHVQAISAALGLTVRLAPTTTIEHLRAKQANQKAATLVGMVQATSGLEGQALNGKMLKRLRRQTARELLAGSNRRLW